MRPTTVAGSFSPSTIAEVGSQVPFKRSTGATEAMKWIDAAFFLPPPSPRSFNDHLSDYGITMTALGDRLLHLSISSDCCTGLGATDLAGIENTLLGRGFWDVVIRQSSATSPLEITLRAGTAPYGSSSF
jgi:hypothetical protein